MLRLHLRCSEWLGGYCWHKGILAFKMRPKHHFIFHLMLDTKAWRLNPRVWSCWGEESYLGKMKYIARSCHGKSMQKRALERYIIGLASFFNPNTC